MLFIDILYINFVLIIIYLFINKNELNLIDFILVNLYLLIFVIMILIG